MPCQNEKTAYPADAPDMHEDEHEDDKPLAKKELAKEKRDPATDDEDYLPLVPPGLPSAAPVKKRKGSRVWQDPTAFLEQEVSRDSRERARDTSFYSQKKKQKVKPCATS